ncbi:MAG: hypothetical protein EPO51_27575 [Phenylobacterium sp.]|uniref:SMI1/KNR4 family protein n=1 Tax=Phenylobacterium sp. TaxID=1871053 RepID=UPI0011FB7919|nr:SMI1/KNR4 family protein [Phenylobacterium sp.]TAJ68637.1 MAG: hypothetical protein EPO51_27575 [Phenylobacterium sp.]
MFLIYATGWAKLTPMTIERLMQVAPPPAKPFQPFIGPWEPVEAYLGTELPPDYKDFARLYGRGRFMEFLVINLPGDPGRRGSLEGELQMSRDMINLGMGVRYPAWPDPDGLLNVGLTEFNDRLFWLPRGDPSDWTIVVWDRALQRLETFDCSLTDFLAGLAAGTILPEAFAGRTLAPDPVFEPSQGLRGLVWPTGPSAVASARTARRGIEALEQVVPPPPEPYRPFTGPWKRVEAYLGTELPQDYKDFARLYGYGLFLGVMIIHVPSNDDPHGTLEAEVREVSRAFNSHADQPYAMWPRVGGLINFGVTENGDYLFWLPIGPPDQWKVVFWDRGLSEDECFEEFDCGMAEFLAGLADGSILPRGHEREDLEPDGPVFQPYSDRVES